MGLSNYEKDVLIMYLKIFGKEEGYAMFCKEFKVKKFKLEKKNDRITF
jgi:hypothetical protein